MNATPRHDFFTVIHKGQRKELFAATVLAGTIDWEDAVAASDFVTIWSKLCSMLEAHAAHEDKHFVPLLARRAPQLVAEIAAGHQALEHELIRLTDTIAVAAAAPNRDHGLAVYRQLSAFVAHYLLHILDEETVVMPAIWRNCTDAEISVARAAFQADQSPAGAIRSRRAILTAITEAERVTMAFAVRCESTDDAVNAFMSDARQLLAPADWNRLCESIDRWQPGGESAHLCFSR